jgi:putative membrane protein insertion efficiency factor
MKDFWFTVKTAPVLAAIFIIRVYQKTLSLDHGLFRFLKPYGFCRFCPTCSEYAVQSLEKYGFLRGGIKALWRVLRCNPWNNGGHDPVN